jgi:hypothetical protein
MKLWTPAFWKRIWNPAEEQIERPDNMSRRNFLRIMGVTATTVAMPGLFVPKAAVVLPDMVLPGTLMGGEQAAADAINHFVRTRLREDVFYRRILPPLEISDDALDKSIPPPGGFVRTPRFPKDVPPLRTFPIGSLRWRLEASRKARSEASRLLHAPAAV